MLVYEIVYCLQCRVLHFFAAHFFVGRDSRMLGGDCRLKGSAEVDRTKVRRQKDVRQKDRMLFFCELSLALSPTINAACGK